ncbi:MAG: AMP-dependent synthetase/ligase [Acidimicrobiia bacterium]
MPAPGNAAVGQPTVPRRFAATVATRGDWVALRTKASDDSWIELTWNDVAEQATRVAGGLAAIGVGRGDRVMLLMRNRPEFHVLDIAVQLVGATPISIYNSSSASQIEYLVGHSGARTAIVEDAGFLNRFLEVRKNLTALRDLFVLEYEQAYPEGVRPYAELLSGDPVDLRPASEIVQPEDLATVIYTSGTTGPPKGVQITHANVCWTVDSILEAFELDPQGKRIVSYLPMAHIAERMVSHYQAITFANNVTTCPDTGKIVQYLGAVRPEIFFGVPRVFEKAAATIGALVGADPEKAAAFQAALALSNDVDARRRAGEAIPDELFAEWERTDAEQLAPWRSILGLDACISAASGAAPLSPGTMLFFRGLGVPLSEIYGLSETCGPLTWAAFAVKPGTVGPAIPGAEIRLDTDGEVLARGGNIFAGYLNAPDKTAEVFTEDGWFRTGDIGVIDDDGYLAIVDRKKELIITAGGKNISPANLESALKGASPVIGQACVIGDARPFIAALIVLDPEVAPVWASAHGIADTSTAALAVEPTVVAEVQRAIDSVNANVSQVEAIRKFTVLPDEWQPDSVELTPTMKLKRRGINERYQQQIEALYNK